jgi:hypothetical protein
MERTYSFRSLTEIDVPCSSRVVNVNVPMKLRLLLLLQTDTLTFYYNT